MADNISPGSQLPPRVIADLAELAMEDYDAFNRVWERMVKTGKLPRRGKGD